MPLCLVYTKILLNLGLRCDIRTPPNSTCVYRRSLDAVNALQVVQRRKSAAADSLELNINGFRPSAALRLLDLSLPSSAALATTLKLKAALQLVHIHPPATMSGLHRRLLQ